MNVPINVSLNINHYRLKQAILKNLRCEKPFSFHCPEVLTNERDMKETSFGVKPFFAQLSLYVINVGLITQKISTLKLRLHYDQICYKIDCIHVTNKSTTLNVIIIHRVQPVYVGLMDRPGIRNHYQSHNITVCRFDYVFPLNMSLYFLLQQLQSTILSLSIRQIQELPVRDGTEHATKHFQMFNSTHIIFYKHIYTIMKIKPYFHIMCAGGVCCCGKTASYHE